MEFDDEAKNNFIKGAKIAYENIVVSFSSGNLSGVKQILSKKVYDQFENAIKDMKTNGQISETTFIGINSAEIKNHENKKGFFAMILFIILFFGASYYAPEHIEGYTSPPAQAK